MRAIIIFVLSALLFAMPTFASTLDGYDRAKVADENYAKMHGADAIPEAVNDPELAAIMKKYIYGDLSQQIKLTDTERQLITLRRISDFRKSSRLLILSTKFLN